MKDCPPLVFWPQRCGVCDTYFKPPFLHCIKGTIRGYAFCVIFFPTKKNKK